MPIIEYPDVPAYDGVPDIPRTSAGSPSINISLASNQISNGNGNQELIWGIFSAIDGSALFTPDEGGTLSTYAFEFSRQTTVATFPTEDGAFASYDKVWNPANPVVTLSFSGSNSEKRMLLNAINAACLDTSLWNVFVPETEYLGYTISRYTYRRMATRGATLLLIDIMLEEVKQVWVSYTSTEESTSTGSSSTSIGSATQSPSAASAKSSGQVQPSNPSSSTLSRAKTWIKRALGIKPQSD